VNLPFRDSVSIQESDCTKEHDAWHWYKHACRQNVSVARAWSEINWLLANCNYGLWWDAMIRAWEVVASKLTRIYAHDRWSGSIKSNRQSSLFHQLPLWSRGEGDIQTTIFTPRAFMSVLSASFQTRRSNTIIVKKEVGEDIPVSTRFIVVVTFLVPREWAWDLFS
jgi:hypothetical protein